MICGRLHAERQAVGRRVLVELVFWWLDYVQCHFVNFVCVTSIVFSLGVLVSNLTREVDLLYFSASSDSQSSFFNRYSFFMQGKDRGGKVTFSFV